eukprot:gene8855-1588_t
MDRSKNVTMVKWDLESELDVYDQLSLPEGYTIRHHVDGDEEAWHGIQSAADTLQNISAQLFAQQFGSDKALYYQRILYLCNSSGNAVGTVAAWRNTLFYNANRFHGRDMRVLGDAWSGGKGEAGWGQPRLAPCQATAGCLFASAAHSWAQKLFFVYLKAQTSHLSTGPTSATLLSWYAVGLSSFMKILVSAVSWSRCLAIQAPKLK